MKSRIPKKRKANDDGDTLPDDVPKCVSDASMENADLTSNSRRPSKATLEPTQRRSRRLQEKDQVDPRSRSPGRRCEPHHRESSPVKPALKARAKPKAGEKAYNVGFYSAEGLRQLMVNQKSCEDLYESYAEPSEVKRPLSPPSDHEEQTTPPKLVHMHYSARASSHKSKKVVGWSEILEW